VLRGRVSEDIYVFTSELYAQVTTGAIVTPAGAVLIDTLPFPVESRELAATVNRTCSAGVRYVVLTHYHADHTYGTFLFPKADVVAHAKCSELLRTVGAPALAAAKAEEPDLEDVIIRLPDITFEEGEIVLQMGNKIMRLIHSPGHTEDSIMVYVEEDRVLFAADTVMPVPSIVDGNVETLRASLQKVSNLPIENLIQGHGEVVLRGEVTGIIKSSLSYLDKLESQVDKVIKSSKGEKGLAKISIESCGLSRIPLNGLVQEIHQANLLYLYSQRTD